MNILVIMGDHLRYDAMSWTDNPLAHTPNIDRLAAKSVRFHNCFCQSPVCSPARHSINTGQYAHRHGVAANGLRPYEGMHTLAHSFKPEGFRCFHRGHMHWQGDQDNGYEPKSDPKYGWVGHDEFDASLSDKARSRKKAEDMDFSLRTSTGGPGPRKYEEFGGYYVRTKTIEQMEEVAKSGDKFLMFAAFSEPHPPWYPPRKYYELVDQSKIVLPEERPENAAPPYPGIVEREQLWEHLTEIEIRQIIAAYYGLTALFDDYVGEILSKLEELGLEDDTLILFSSDHGDQLYENRLFLKFITREASVHVPLMIHMPGQKKAIDRDELVEHVDIFPTFCELTGVPVPDTVQGRSLVPLLGRDNAPDDWRDMVFSEIERQPMHIIMGRTKKWKLNLYEGQAEELFDLEADPGEHYNLIASPEHQDIIHGLQKRIEQWRESTALQEEKPRR